MDSQNTIPTITADALLPEVLSQYPGTRTVFDRYYFCASRIHALAKSSAAQNNGARYHDRASLSARGVDMNDLLDELRLDHAVEGNPTLSR